MRIRGLWSQLRRRRSSNLAPADQVADLPDKRTHPDQPRTQPWWTTAPTKPHPVVNRLTLGQSCLYDVNRRPQ